jgi:hypothetical protein
MRAWIRFLPDFLVTRSIRDARKEQKIERVVERIKKDLEAAMTGENNFFDEDDPSGHEGNLYHHVRLRLETSRLKAKADRLGIDIPAEWFTHYWGVSAVMPEVVPKLKKMIFDERYNRWKKRIDLILPFLTALTGFIGALIGTKC